jgi:hypothetical protein
LSAPPPRRRVSRKAAGLLWAPRTAVGGRVPDNAPQPLDVLAREFDDAADAALAALYGVVRRARGRFEVGLDGLDEVEPDAGGSSELGRHQRQTVLSYSTTRQGAKGACASCR